MAGIDPNTRTRDLTEAESGKLRENIERDYRVEGDLRREFALSIRRLIEIGCYRGLRHRRGLPVRGQRTTTNGRIRKGPKRTGPGKRKAKKWGDVRRANEKNTKDGGGQRQSRDRQKGG